MKPNESLLDTLLELQGLDFPNGAKHTAEEAATRELTAPLGERVVELIDEFNRAESKQARFVKACDKLQLMIKVARYESWGAGGLSGFWANPDNFPVDEFESVNQGATRVAGARSKLSRPLRGDTDRLSGSR